MGSTGDVHIPTKRCAVTSDNKDANSCAATVSSNGPVVSCVDVNWLPSNALDTSTQTVEDGDEADDSSVQRMRGRDETDGLARAFWTRCVVGDAERRRNLVLSETPRGQRMTAWIPGELAFSIKFRVLLRGGCISTSWCGRCVVSQIDTSTRCFNGTLISENLRQMLVSHLGSTCLWLDATTQLRQHKQGRTVQSLKLLLQSGHLCHRYDKTVPDAKAMLNLLRISETRGSFPQRRI